MIFFSHPRVSFFLTRIGSDYTKIQGFFKKKNSFEFFSHPRVSFFFRVEFFKIGKRDVKFIREMRVACLKNNRWTRKTQLIKAQVNECQDVDLLIQRQG